MKKIKQICFLFIISFTLLYISSCKDKTPPQPTTSELTYEEEEAIFNDCIKDVKDYYYLGEEINLNNLANIKSYTYDKQYYIIGSTVSLCDDFKDVRITLSVLVKNYTFKKTFTIKQDIDKYFDKVFEYIFGFVSTGIVAKDLRLVSEYIADKSVTITYKSLNPAFVTDEGVRIDHEYDEDVTIECVVSKDGYSKMKEINFTSRGIDYNTRYAKALEYIDEFFATTHLTEGTVLPTELPNYGGRIRWLSDDPTVIYDYKTIHLPKEAKTTRLLCEIVFASTINNYLIYEVNLEKRSDDITDLDYLKTFFETVYGEGLDDYAVFYSGDDPLINTSKLIDPLTVKNQLFFGLEHPSVSQAKLDKLFYPGYTIPNEENVLWIVVHETGVSYAGRDALFFAEAQWNKAYDNAYDDASWAFTVDDHSIYQSFATTMPLWHAADGRTEGGGNKNGIGIEMCVNSDGNYELALRNNARLMASLLLEYNLGMNNMRRHHDFYEPKLCPEKIITNKRWYEYLTLIEREYISQSIIKNFTVTYDIDCEMKYGDGIDYVKNIYSLVDIASGTPINLTITIDGVDFVIQTFKK